jgi:hypothetical protein
VADLPEKKIKKNHKEILENDIFYTNHTAENDFVKNVLYRKTRGCVTYI